MAIKNLLLTFKYKSDGQIKFLNEPEPTTDPLLEDIVYKQRYKYWSEFRPTPEEKKKEKWLPYKYNPNVRISNYGGIWVPGAKYGCYPAHRAKDGYIRFGVFKDYAWHNKHSAQTITMNLPLEVCRLFVPMPEGRTLYSRVYRDGNPKNPRAENMTVYTGYRNAKKKNPYYSYQTVLNMVEKRKKIVEDYRRKGIDPFDGW